MKSLLLFLLIGLSSVEGHAGKSSKIEKPGPDFYRQMTLRIREAGIFRVYMPDSRHVDIPYKMEWGDPLLSQPLVNDFKWAPPKPDVMRSFWDRILLRDGSYVEIGGERLPLTCVFVSGQDNRFMGQKSPVIPDFIVNVYLVANDFSCQGPIRPGWPGTGGRKEAWDTYLHFEVRDPTIMLPSDAVVRYRWNEFNAIFVDPGAHP